MVSGLPGEPTGSCSDQTDRLKLPPGATAGVEGGGVGVGDAEQAEAADHHGGQCGGEQGALTHGGYLVCR